MEGNLVDLDLLLAHVRDPGSHGHIQDAVRAYRAGARRPALTAVWVAVAFDLIAKYRELSAAGDAAATAWLDQWSKAVENESRDRLLRLERDLLDHATREFELVDPHAKRQLDRLREDRHLCAHPAFSQEASLFDPSPELVRLHITNAIELVLSQPPRQGKALLKQFQADLASTGFPVDPARLADYFEQRYLNRARPAAIRMLGIVLAKSILKGAPPEWEDRRDRVTGALQTLRDRAIETWPEIRREIVRLAEDVSPDARSRVILLLSELPEIWSDLGQATRMALTETITGTTAEELVDYSLLRGVRIPALREYTLDLIEKLTAEQLADVLREEVLLDYWPAAVKLYASSPAWRTSENRFRTLISPFSGRISSELFDGLLEAILSTSQNYSASGTPSLLREFVAATDDNDLPGRDKRDQFFQRLNGMGGGDYSTSLMMPLRRDGWAPPNPEVPDDDDD